MTSLTERLSQAEAGSRDMSDEVLLACGWGRDNEGFYRDPIAKCWLGNTRPSPTESVDDALALVPEGCGWNLDWHGVGSFDAGVKERRDGDYFGANAATPALALCIAILRAHSSKGGENG